MTKTRRTGLLLAMLTDVIGGVAIFHKAFGVTAVGNATLYTKNRSASPDNGSRRFGCRRKRYSSRSAPSARFRRGGDEPSCRPESPAA